MTTPFDRCLTAPFDQDLEGGVILVGPDRPPDWLLKELDAEGLPAAFLQKQDYDGTGGLFTAVLHLVLHLVYT